MEPRPAPEASAYDPEWRHSPGIQYGIGIGTGIALGNVPFAPIAMDFGIATGMVGNGSKYANVGRALGEMAVGSGVTGEVLGGLLDVTTIGAFLGVPVAVVSYGLVVSGLADLGAGAAELSAAMSQADEGGSGSSAATNASPAAGATGSAGKRNVDELIKAAQKEFPDKAGKVQEHHITPIYLGGDRKGPTVKIDAAYHQKITNEFRRQWAYGREWPDAVARQRIMRDVYNLFPLP